MSPRTLRSILAVVAVAGACALCFGAVQASARPTAPAHTASPAAAQLAIPFKSVAKFILTGVARSLVFAGSNALLGSILSAIGLGDDTAAQLDAINSKLDQINQKLDALSNQVSQVLTAVQQGTCASLSGQLDQTRSRIDVAWRRYQRITELKSKPVRKAQAKLLLAYLDQNLEYEAAQLEIHNKLANPGAGAIGLITACGQAIQSPSGLLTSKSALPVRQVLDFWQGYEAKLLVLQVEVLRAHGKLGEARAAKNTLEATFRQELATLRPSVPAGQFYDKATQRMWFQNIPLQTTYLDASGYAKQISDDSGKRWHLPTQTDIDGLAADCCPGTTVPNTVIDDSDPDGLQDFYGALIRKVGVTIQPVAGTDFAKQVEKIGAKLPDRNHVPLVINGFSNALIPFVNPTAPDSKPQYANLGGYTFVWYRVPDAQAQYGY